MQVKALRLAIAAASAFAFLAANSMIANAHSSHSNAGSSQDNPGGFGYTHNHGFYTFAQPLPCYLVMPSGVHRAC
jgi:hypothetical protein